MIISWCWLKSTLIWRDKNKVHKSSSQLKIGHFTKNFETLNCFVQKLAHPSGQNSLQDSGIFVNIPMPKDRIWAVKVTVSYPCFPSITRNSRAVLVAFERSLFCDLTNEPIWSPAQFCLGCQWPDLPHHLVLLETQASLEKWNENHHHLLQMWLDR